MLPWGCGRDADTIFRRTPLCVSLHKCLVNFYTPKPAYPFSDGRRTPTFLQAPGRTASKLESSSCGCLIQLVLCLTYTIVAPHPLPPASAPSDSSAGNVQCQDWRRLWTCAQQCSFNYQAAYILFRQKPFCLAAADCQVGPKKLIPTAN